MRRKEKQISEAKVKELLLECKIVRLAFFADNYPYIVPLNYGYTEIQEEQILYMHCATEGRKINLLNTNPHVGFEMDLSGGFTNVDNPSANCSTIYSSLIGTGDLSIVSDNKEKITALSVLMKHLTNREVTTFDEKVIAKTHLLKLCIKNICGKESLS